jgi:hypothetical protein
VKTLQQLIDGCGEEIWGSAIAEVCKEAHELGRQSAVADNEIIAEAVEQQADARINQSADVMAFAMLRHMIMERQVGEMTVILNVRELAEWMQGYSLDKEYLPDGRVKYSLKVVS